MSEINEIMDKYQLIFEGYQIELEKILHEWSGQPKESTKEFVKKNFQVYGCFKLSKVLEKSKRFKSEVRVE